MYVYSFTEIFYMDKIVYEIGNKKSTLKLLF